MRAALLTEYRKPLSIETVPDPKTPRDGVVLRVLACGVCRSDWHGWRGEDPDIALPHIPGHEFCGVIEEVGPEVRDWRVGDRVVAPFVLACGRCHDCRSGEATICSSQVVPGFTVWGAFAERIAVPRADANLARLPETLDPAAAAALGCRTTTAFRAVVDRGRLMPGEWLAVHGCGGVGLSAIQIGAALGARVVAVDISPEALALAKRMGAEIAIDARGGPSGEAVREATKGGAHVSIEALGRSETFEQSVRSLRPLGRHVQIGMPTGAGTRPELPLDVVYSRQLTLHGTRGMPAHRYPSLFAMIEAGRIDPGALVTRRIDLSAASEALAAMDGPTGPGVTVITSF